MIVDSHCHLDYDPMAEELDLILDRALINGVKYFLTISTKNESFDKILNIIKKYKPVYGSYGIHPHEAKNHLHITKAEIIKNVKKSKKIIGIGETGLDFYYNHSDQNDQKKLFVEHIKASQELNLPLIVHTRSAEEETLNILKSEMKNKSFKILIHCFTGSKEFAFNLLDLGAYISASGVVTFKKSTDLANTFKEIPLEKILVETDSPYLAPVPLRGKSNEPSYIKHTVDFISDLKKLNSNKFSQITSDNFFKLFGNLN